MRRSHKARLALTATLVAALVMGAVFALVVVSVRRIGILEERDEIEQAFRTVASIRLPNFSMKELGEAGPALRARVYDDHGRLVAHQGTMPDPPGELREGFGQRGRWLFYAARAKGERVVLARDLREVDRDVVEMAAVLGIVWLPLALLVGGATWLAAQATFRPLARLSREATALEWTDLSQRLTPPDEAEFGAFADDLNRMLARIEESVARSERFAADAAHELRTPLAVLRTQIETTLLRPRPPEAYVASHRALLDEIERLSTIVESLLRTARTPLAQVPAHDLAPLVEASALRWRSRLEEEDLRLRFETVAVAARMATEEVAVVLDNLLDNARRYAPKGGEVAVLLTREGGDAVLRVVDHGPGVPTEESERVFERFYRLDEARGRSTGGAGIGLAMCRRIVAARGGTIALEATPGGGATFVARLPAA